MNQLTQCKENITLKDTSCIVCGFNQARAVYAYHYDGHRAHILRCLSCGHMFIYPIPLIDLESRTMESLSDAEFFGNGFLKILHENIVINREIRWVRKFIHGSAPRLLDIGCGTGWTTAIWRKNGFKTVGLEPSLQRGKLAQEKYGIEIYHAHIERFEPKEKFDLVIMRHLLEHIKDPQELLSKIHSFLHKDGLLLVVIPNINSLGRYLFREHFAWVLPWHLHFYNPKTLTMLLEKNGYKKMKIYQMPSPLWYPEMLCQFFGENHSITKFFKRRSRIFNIAFCSPIVFLGLLLNLNDNMTLIFKNNHG